MVPERFVAWVTNRSGIQVIERRDRFVFGVQFHPERYNALYPSGATVLRNFLTVARDQGKDALGGVARPVRGIR